MTHIQLKQHTTMTVPLTRLTPGLDGVVAVQVCRNVRKATLDIIVNRGGAFREL